MSRKRKTPQTRAKRTSVPGNNEITHFISPGPLTGSLELASSATTLTHRLKFNLPQKRNYPVLTYQPQGREYTARLPKISGQTLPVVIMALAGSIAWFYGPSYFDNFWNILLGLVIEVVPFLLLGAGLAAAIAQGGFSKLKIWDLAARNRASAAAAGLGMSLTLPVCECGTASIARQANRAGAPVALSMVFLLAAPIINPVTLLVTYLAFEGNWLIILGRTGLGLVVALVVGLIFSLYPRPIDLFAVGATPAAPDEPAHNAHPHTHEYSPARLDLSRPKTAAFNNFVDRLTVEFIDTVRVVLPGITLAAAFQACVPPRYFLDLGQGALFSAMALMLLAGLMSICSSADAFVALSFAALLPSGSILAFLVFGPLINLKSIFLFRLVLRWRSIGLMALLCFSLVLVAAVFCNLWLV